MTDIVDRLRAIIAPVLSDDRLAAGARLSESGYRKVAARLGIDAAEAASLVESLAGEIRMQRLYEQALNEGGARFSCEKDFLDNVTVRDNQSGKSCFLRGSEASAVLNRIAAGGDEQQILAAYAHLMEGKKKKVETLDEDDESTFHHEIHSSHGAYNFPWRAGDQSGFATARFKGRGPNMKISILSVRDSDGESVDLDESMTQAVHDQAVAFIGDE